MSDDASTFYGVLNLLWFSVVLARMLQKTKTGEHSAGKVLAAHFGIFVVGSIVIAAAVALVSAL